jgi:hypothetical protein
MTRASIAIGQRRSRGLALHARQVACPCGWRQLVAGRHWAADGRWRGHVQDRRRAA